MPVCVFSVSRTVYVNIWVGGLYDLLVFEQLIHSSSGVSVWIFPQLKKIEIKKKNPLMHCDLAK